MYRIILQLPLGVTLVHQEEFESENRAAEVIANLPTGFLAVIEGDVPPDAIVFPLKLQRPRPQP